MIFIVVRQEVSNLDSSVVVHELELAKNRDFFRSMYSFLSIFPFFWLITGDSQVKREAQTKMAMLRPVKSVPIHL